MTEHSLTIEQHLTKIARYKELDYNFHPADEEWTINRAKVIESVLLKMDMTFQTYAEDSWTRNVWKAFNQVKESKCMCDDCWNWRKRLWQIEQEVEYEISCRIHNYEGTTVQ